MAQKAKGKLRIVPVSREEALQYIIQKVTEHFEPAIDWMDEYNGRYEHELPWNEKFLKKPRYYLWQVAIGVMCDERFKTVHFTSMGLYNMARVARMMRRAYECTYTIEDWADSIINEKNPSSNYLSYYK